MNRKNPGQAARSVARTGALVLAAWLALTFGLGSAGAALVCGGFGPSVNPIEDPSAGVSALDAMVASGRPLERLALRWRGDAPMGFAYEASVEVAAPINPAVPAGFPRRQIVLLVEPIDFAHARLRVLEVMQSPGGETRELVSADLPSRRAAYGLSAAGSVTSYGGVLKLGEHAFLINATMSTSVVSLAGDGPGERLSSAFAPLSEMQFFMVEAIVLPEGASPPTVRLPRQWQWQWPWRRP